MAITKIMIKDVLRYIGMSGETPTEELIQKIHMGYNFVEEISQPRVHYKLVALYKQGDTISFGESSFKTKSKDLSQLFIHCESCYIMAATLGHTVDRQIGIKQKLDMLDAIILDACSSVWIEKICDTLEEEIMSQLKFGQFLTMRFSPGYGDVQLDAQQGILEVLSAYSKLGLGLTDTNMLIPSKSITAFIGISNQKENRQKNCSTCYLVGNCMYKRKGENCGV